MRSTKDLTGASDEVDKDALFEELLHTLARTPEVFAAHRPLHPGTVLAGRFEIRRALGRGGMGRVFSAYDRKRDVEVALKVVGNVTPRGIGQIKREFRNAAELEHPNLLRHHELFCDGFEWFFTMDLIEGVSLSALRSQAGALEDTRLRSLFEQLAVALLALHDAGTVHGDLKPSNFLIEASGRLVLMDFGISRPLASSDEQFCAGGTPAYMSPEQAAGLPLTEASDWYSFGVVLYEALTGALPSAREISEPDALCDLPEPLASLCLALLAQSPAARPSGDEVLARLSANEQSARSSRPPPLSRSRFVGRRSELASFLGALARCRSLRRPVVQLVSGCSGIGKSALLAEFASKVRSENGLVLAGRCRERESVGHKAIDSLIDSLVSRLDGMPRAESSAILPSDIADLTRLFPALRAAVAVAHAPQRGTATVDQSIAKQRASAAFRELLANLARKDPLVIWIDDLQWADAESAALLSPVLAADSDLPLLFIGSYQSGISGRGPLLDELYRSDSAQCVEAHELRLEPLRSSDARALALQLLTDRGSPSDTLASDIAREAEGMPLFIEELARASGVFESGPTPPTLADLISARLAELSDEALRLLDIMALAGAPLNRAVLRVAAGLDGAGAERALRALRSQKLLRSEGLQEDSQLAVIHDRIREVVTHTIDGAARPQLHLALARALEVRNNARPDLIASHFAAAGALPEAGAYWITAADRATETLAFARAAELYELGVRHGSLDVEARHQVRLRQAQALAHAGKGHAASVVYLEEAKGRPQEQLVRLKRLAAEQLLLVGHLDRGIEVIDDVLSGLKMRKTRSGKRLLCSVVFGRMRVKLRGLTYQVRPESERSERELARIDAAWTVAISLGAVDFMRGTDLQSDHLLLALDAGEPRRLLRALALEVSYSAADGHRGAARTEALLALVAELATHTDDHAALGLVQLIHGLSDYLRGRIAAAHPSFERAIHTFETHCSGAVWESMTGHRFAIGAEFYLGRFAALSERIPPLLAEAEAQGNLYAGTFLRTHFCTVAWLVRDQPLEARRQLATAHKEWDARGFQLPHCAMLVAQIYIDLYEHDWSSAWRHLELSWPALQRSDLLRVKMVRVQLFYLRAAVAASLSAEASERGASRRSAELANEAKRTLRSLRRESSPLAEPLALTVDASCARTAGELASARVSWELAAQKFDEQQLKLFAAAARARLGALLGDCAEGEVLSASAQRAFEYERVQVWSRMVDLLVPR